jgi:hypothetical protein
VNVVSWTSRLAIVSRAARRILAICALGVASSAAIAANGAAADGTQASSGAIIGIVTNPEKIPVPRATVKAVKADGSSFHAVLSGSDGSYSFSDLSPGQWSITAHVDGYADVSAPVVTVGANEAARSDIVLKVPELPILPVPAVSAGLQAPDAAPEVDNDTPFAFGDFTWLNGNPRNHAPAVDTKFFTPDVRFDASYVDDFNHPVDHTVSGSTEEFRSGEVQLDQISVGGDFHYDNVKARLLTMWGLFATTIPDNDGSSGAIGGVGQQHVQDAYRYISEASAGYHFDVNHGLNVDLGIFASYIGLFSFYNYDNWTYQPSYVSSNTPWVFNGIRIQWYPTNTLKIEPWIINGWASYNKFNGRPGLGGQILWIPNEYLKLVFNNYGYGTDTLANSPGNPLAQTTRIHTDDSILVKYYESKDNGLGVSKAAFSLTLDAGCQHGGGVTCTTGPNKSNFLGWMLYDRYWFDHDRFAVTLGGGSMGNPGRYLTLLPPINGATGSTGTPYFTENPGQTLYQWDTTINFQYMPAEWITWWTEGGFRHSSVPYWNGQGGMTPPGGNNGSPQDYACNQTNPATGTTSSGINGVSPAASYASNPLAAAQAACAGAGGVWYPDLRTREAMWSFGVMVKF